MAEIQRASQASWTKPLSEHVTFAPGTSKMGIFLQKTENFRLSHTLVTLAEGKNSAIVSHVTALAESNILLKVSKDWNT